MSPARVHPQFNGKQWTLTIPKQVANMMSLEKGDLFEITITGNCEDPTITLRRVKG